MREWLASPEHRANLLRPGYARIGIGLVRGSFLGNGGATVVTADFAGRSSKQCQAPSVAWHWCSA